MLIDTHCHINMLVKKQFDQELTEKEILDAKKIIDNAKKNGCMKIINVGTSIVESKNCITLAQTYENVFAAIGIHPTDVTSSWKNDIKQLRTWLQEKEQNKIVGIGEVGLDRYHKPFDLQLQIDSCKAQIELALEHDLAIVIHSRDAYDETLKLLEDYKHEKKRGIIHCFSYDVAFAQEVIKQDFVIGIGGTLTYPKNETLRHVVRNVTLSDIVLETDAPFLAPQEKRGQTNTPAFLYLTCNYLAELIDQPTDLVAEQTSSNAIRVFNL